jgi:hypothetical protein
MAEQEDCDVHSETVLKLSAAAFALLWTALMWWDRAPLETSGVIALMVCGALAGLIWYWLYGKWFRRYFRR